MAAYEKRARTITRHEYVLETPSNGAELAKMIAGAKLDAGNVIAIGDDTLHVDAQDGELVIWWEDED